MNEELLDAMRGVLWEEKWRGTLEQKGQLESIVLEAKRWIGIPVPSSNASTGYWPYGCGLGTYKWKYDRRIIEEAIRLGAGIIDTAETYGYGKVERELGVALKGKPKRVWIASKVSRNHMSYAATLSAAKRGRDALQVDRIDLYQLHWPVFSKIESTLDALARLREEGVINHVGVCNFCAGQLATVCNLAAARGFSIVSNQFRLNRVDDSATRFLLPYCRKIGVKTIAYSPLGQGKVCGAGSLEWVEKSGVDSWIPATNDLGHLRENLKRNPARKRG